VRSWLAHCGRLARRFGVITWQ